jgi:hypothetical protein
MKNVHLLPTDKPSRLYKTGNFLLLDSKSMPNNTLETINQNIYITNDEEIKEGDYVVVSCSEIEIEEVRLVIGYYNEQFLFDDRGQIHMDYCKKIILTTDPQLIADGVQPIDNEFLEWFVKNPSCEFVETQCSGRNCIEDFGCTKEGCNGVEPLEIIIPQEELKHPKVFSENGNELFFDEQGNLIREEPDYTALLQPVGARQETIEEANWKVLGTKTDSFYNGAKWMEERMYSEEEVIAIVEKSRETGLTAEYLLLTDQFKKK